MQRKSTVSLKGVGKKQHWETQTHTDTGKEGATATHDELQWSWWEKTKESEWIIELSPNMRHEIE